MITIDQIKIYFFVNEEYWGSQSGGGNDVISDLHALKQIFRDITIIKLVKNIIFNNNLIDLSNPKKTVFIISGFLTYERLFASINENTVHDILKIINIKDLHFLRELRHEMLLKDKRNHGDVMSREINIYKKCNLVLSYSDDEVKLLKKIDPTINAYKHYYYNPNFIPIFTGFRYNRKLIFVGNFEHSPNIDAVRFLQKISNDIPKDIEILIYGSKSKQVLTSLNLSNSFQVMGEIDNIADAYAQGGIFISPLRFGGGVKIKIIEAALSGLPIIATQESVEGLPLIEGKSYIKLKTTEDFINTVIQFKNQDALFKHLSLDAFNRIEKISNEQLIKNNIINIIENILDD
jgi:glycosyltransferase involved in cell wall biosynthesis